MRLAAGGCRMADVLCSTSRKPITRRDPSTPTGPGRQARTGNLSIGVGPVTAATGPIQVQRCRVPAAQASTLVQSYFHSRTRRLRLHARAHLDPSSIVGIHRKRSGHDHAGRRLVTSRRTPPQNEKLSTDQALELTRIQLAEEMSPFHHLGCSSMMLVSWWER